MPKKERYQGRIELLQGTLDVLILQTLRWGPRHGYGISQAIRASSREVLTVDTGSLYPAYLDSSLQVGFSGHRGESFWFGDGPSR